MPGLEAAVRVREAKADWIDWGKVAKRCEDGRGMWNQESKESAMGAYPCKSPANICEQIVLDNTSPVQAIAEFSVFSF